MPLPRGSAAALSLALVLSGCMTPDESEGGQRQAEAVDDGVQLTGRIDGARIAVSRGNPEVVVGDCDPLDGPDEDVCWVARTIDGVSVAFVIENPAVLAADTTVAVRDADCIDCDDVVDHAVVDLRIDGDQRRVLSGRLDVRQAGPRYAAGFEVTLPGGGTLNGRFNVRPLLPEER